MAELQLEGIVVLDTAAARLAFAGVNTGGRRERLENLKGA